jgi:methionine-R-sulfoxide reductase
MKLNKMSFLIVFFTIMGTGVVHSKSSDQALKKLSKLQYHVTQEAGTEPAFQNEYWNEKRPGIYVDVVTGEPLFSSLDKYDSGTGWPSFTKGINENSFTTKLDLKLGVPRKEIRSKTGNSHLGHVFDDGPKDKGGKRFCINSAALRFIPFEKLEQEGYGKYKAQFEGAGAISSVDNK